MHMRGGNTRHTRDIRFAHEGPNVAATGTYAEAELLDDLLRVTGGETDRRLADLTIGESTTLADWMTGHGVRWQQPLKGTLHLSRTNGFFLGGGKASGQHLLRHGRSGSACAWSTMPPSPASRLRGPLRARAVAVRPAVARSGSACGAVRRRRGRIRSRPRLAARVLGRRRGRIRDPRYAVQHGARAQGALRGRGQANRRPARAALHCGRRPRSRASTAGS